MIKQLPNNIPIPSNYHNKAIKIAPNKVLIVVDPTNDYYLSAMAISEQQ